ncbi:hypothetical protein ACFCZ1_15105 [Streptomyces sp. NPDC056224]|uniref:hypothetical protein n=1 Tax=Streptomyces TaxID=1883 RepID=UPI00207A2F5B|nr:MULTISPECIES: hypothetical protein [Streptomyces]MCM9078014.1 hypothetical protein [Streptomyces spororaveus]
MDPEALNLVQAGGAAIVAAMVTDAWHTARTRTVQLFQRRGRNPREIEAQLDRSAARVRREGTEAAREGAVVRWRDDLEDLLSEYPDAADDLQALVREVEPQLPPVQQQWVQKITASAAGATAQGAMFGSIINHPGSLSGTAATTGSGADSAAEERQDRRA